MNRATLFGAALVAMLSLAGCEVGSEPVFGTADGGSAAAEQAGVSEHAIAKGRLNFVEGYQKGYDVAAREGKPMMLFFTAEWCHFCHQMADEAFTDAQVVGLSQHFVCVLIDAEQEPEICRQFRVDGYPTVQFLSARGTQLNRMVGKRPGHQLMMAMQAALQNIARRETGTLR